MNKVPETVPFTPLTIEELTKKVESVNMNGKFQVQMFDKINLREEKRQKYQSFQTLCQFNDQLVGKQIYIERPTMTVCLHKTGGICNKMTFTVGDFVTCYAECFDCRKKRLAFIGKTVKTVKDMVCSVCKEPGHTKANSKKCRLHKYYKGEV